MSRGCTCPPWLLRVAMHRLHHANCYSTQPNTSQAVDMASKVRLASEFKYW